MDSSNLTLDRGDSSGGLRKRISRLQEEMAERGVDISILLYSRDILYYTGTTQPSIFLVTPEDYRLFVQRGMDFVLEETWIDKEMLKPCGGYDDVCSCLRRWNVKSGVIGLELDVIPAEIYLNISRALPSFQIKSVSPMILEQRMEKDPMEVKDIREACRILHKGHEMLVGVFQEGITELDLSARIEEAHRIHGHEGQYFIRQFDFSMGRGPMASGENLSRITGRVFSISGVGLSPSIPAGASMRPIQRGDLFVVDIPVIHNGYHADQSRTYSVGRPSSWCMEMHQGLKEIEDRIMGMIRPGLRCCEIYQEAVRIAGEIGIGPYFMRIGRNLREIDFIGHGIGLELNEPPLIGPKGSNPLKEGTVITLEMECTRSVEEAVKLEDTILVHSKGTELLTITPRTLFEL